MVHLKYIFLHVHEQSISNFLRFLGYWDAFGYSKYTQFGSSVRVELVRKIDAANADDKYYFQFIYDDEVLQLPWCNNVNGGYCPFDDFIEYAAEHVILDYDYVD